MLDPANDPTGVVFVVHARPVESNNWYTPANCNFDTIEEARERTKRGIARNPRIAFRILTVTTEIVEHVKPEE